MPRIVVCYRPEPERDRWLPGDRFVRPYLRKLLRGKPRMGGIDKVVHNLCLGLDRLGVQYELNLPYDRLSDRDRVVVLGRGRHCLDGYRRRTSLVAGIGLMTHPSEWPNLCEEYPVSSYLQHSEWTNAIYIPYFGHRCRVWPVGIDTDTWNESREEKDLDVLIYDKVYWERPSYEASLIHPIREALSRRRLRVAEIQYGGYVEEQYQSLLRRSKTMIFLSAHESQGLAYLECLSSGVPILAWDQGRWLDPNRFRWGTPAAPATSVPYFDSRCGDTFKHFEEFEAKFDGFYQRAGRSELDPRSYIMETLTLERCSGRLVQILNEDADTGHKAQCR